MADVVPISGGPEEAKIRSVLAPVLLPFITFGIYGLVWYYKINRELADLGRKNNREDLGTNPMMSLIAVTFGIFLIIPPFLSLLGTWKRTKAAQGLVGIPEPEQGNGLIAFLLWFFIGIVYSGYVQNELNKVWKRQPGAGLPDATAVTAVAPATPAAAAGLPGTEQPASPTNLPGIPGS